MQGDGIVRLQRGFTIASKTREKGELQFTSLIKLDHLRIIMGNYQSETNTQVIHIQRS